MFPLLFIFLVIAMSIFTRSQDVPDINQVTNRPALVAGSFYPDNPDTLKSSIYKYLDSAAPLRIKDDIIGIIAPHAGYSYSGWVAGKTYRELRGRKYDAVIIIGPSHHFYFSGSSVFNGDVYNTPLGPANIDVQLSIDIAKFKSGVNLSLNGHSWTDTSAEHSVEVQIPFIQTMLPNTPIVPIVMGTQDFNSINILSQALISAIKKSGKKVLLVASTDLSHFHDWQTARNLDFPLVKSFEKMDYFRISFQSSNRSMEACGSGSLIVVMMVSEALGANKAKPLSYATSADSPFIRGDRNRVVGYFSGVLTKSDKHDEFSLPEINEQNKIEILEVAKRGIENAIKGDTNLVGALIPGQLSDEYAAFVTIRKKGELRGCMGHTFAQQPLLLEIEQSATLAAASDYRFEPLDSSEIQDIDIEITILSRMKRLYDTNMINVGTDGLMLRIGRNSGLFLPQVATSNNWNRTEFLENLGIKAGLDKSAYKHPNAELYYFRAIKINQ